MLLHHVSVTCRLLKHFAPAEDRYAGKAQQLMRSDTFSFVGRIPYVGRNCLTASTKVVGSDEKEES